MGGSTQIRSPAREYAKKKKEAAVPLTPQGRVACRIIYMETNADGTYFQEGDRVRIKNTGQLGRINAAAGGVVYVLMDDTDESRLFAAYVDTDAAIELVTTEEA